MAKSTDKKIKDFGLDTTEVSHVIDQLNALLANYHIFYMNVRGYHWNVSGSDFLHYTSSLKSFIPRYNYKLMNLPSAF
ncbi:hypothetical protein [Faucicola atlantae]|uniref:hypothetical protein n=1 Tax=Faucicola atlantae TaxID=34059 RepID=UPI0025B0A3D6|nr:hypothetical protein [Moraxella atlantae]